MTDHDSEDDLQQDIDEAEDTARELASLFGEEIVEQAQLLDIADLNLTDEMTGEIATGIRQLKQMKHDPAAQRKWISGLNPARQLLLCMWIMDMDLLEKLRSRT